MLAIHTRTRRECRVGSAQREQQGDGGGQDLTRAEGASGRAGAKAALAPRPHTQTRMNTRALCDCIDGACMHSTGGRAGRRAGGRAGVRAGGQDTSQAMGARHRQWFAQARLRKSKTSMRLDIPGHAAHMIGHAQA